MSTKTLETMQKHLELVEQYIKGLDKAVDKNECISAMNTCRDGILALYKDMEAVAPEFKEIMKSSAKHEVKEISEKIGDLLSKKIIEFYPKTGIFLAETDYQKAQAELDGAISNSPLFGDNSMDDQVAIEVSKSFASTMDKMATQLEAETAASDEGTVSEVIEMMEVFKAYSERYVESMKTSNSARKIVMSTDKFVDSVKKMLPDMNKHVHAIQVLMAKKDKPEQIVKIGEELKSILGEQLSTVIKDKEELLDDHKVKKSVGKLGQLLQQIPF